MFTERRINTESDAVRRNNILGNLAKLRRPIKLRERQRERQQVSSLLTSFKTFSHI